MIIEVRELWKVIGIQISNNRISKLLKGCDIIY